MVSDNDPLSIASDVLASIPSAAPHWEMVDAVDRAVVRQFVMTVIGHSILEYSLSVFDGEETVLRRSRDPDAVMDALMSTGVDTLHVHDGPRYVGFVSAVYGNSGHDVLANWTDSDEISSLMRRAVDLANAFEDAIAERDAPARARVDMVSEPRFG